MFVIRNEFIREKIMRYFFYMCALAVMLSGCASSDDVVLNFHVDDPSAKEVVLVCHDEIATFPVDESGNAVAVLDRYDAAYARIFYGMNFQWIYFERGDKADISFNGQDFVRSFAFDGEKKLAVEYLNTVKLTALPDEDYALPFDEYYKRIKGKVREAEKLLEANGLSSAGGFEKMEKARIRYSYGAQVLMYPTGHKIMAGDMSYEPDEAYYEVVGSYLEDSADLVDLDEFMDYVLEASHVLDADNRNVTEMYPKTVAQMRFIVDRFQDADLRQTLLHRLAATYVDRYGTEDIQDMENIYRTYVKDESMLADYEAKCDKWDVSRAGRPSPDFKAYDLDGKEWSLADFRGKYVYIDLWATWCNPCRKEFPYMKELSESFKDAEIVFLGLSTDKDKEKWEDMVRSGVLSGVQLYLGSGSDFQKAYRVEGIPHFILIGKDGRIISNSMSRPSDPKTAETFEALPGIR